MSKVGPIVDWWILPHFCFFVVLSSTIEASWSPRWWVHAIYWAVLTTGWEITEHFLERAYPEKWSYVLEHWANKAFTDPIANGIGVIVGVLGVLYFRGQR